MDTPTFLLFICATFLVQNVHSEYKFCASRNKEEQCKQLEGAQNDFRCVYAQDSVDCLEKLETNEVDFSLFSAEEALLAATDDRNLLVVADTRHNSRQNEEYEFQMVAVVRSNFESGINGLRGKKYCNAAPTTSHYWTDTVHRAFEKTITKSLSLKCDENKTFTEIETQALSEFFSGGCRPGRWSVNNTLNAKLKMKYINLCSLCDNPITCEYEKTTHGKSAAALNCLTKKGGDAAFVTLSAVKHFISENSTAAAEYKYLCENGTTQSFQSSLPCTWIKQSWPTILAKQRIASELSKKLNDIYSSTSRGSLQWTDRLKQLIAPESYEIHVVYANPNIKSYVTRGRAIPTNSNQCGSGDIKWCTQSSYEFKKCQILSKAGQTHSIVPNIVCETPVDNITECLNSINVSRADIVSSPSDYGFIARKSYNLTSVMYVKGIESAKYVGLIVIKSGSSIKSVSQLKGKRSCFPFFNGMGWLTFLEVARNENLISKSACTEDGAVTSFFGNSCVPGANSPLNSLNKTAVNNLCAACSSKGLGGTCDDTVNNPVFGEEGALRCLSSGAGEVAFLNLNAIQSFLNGNRSSDNRPIKPEDLMVLCKNGTIVKWSKTGLENCAFTSVIANEIVTRKTLKKGRFADIELSLESFEDWFDSTERSDKIIHLFGNYLNNRDVLLPSDGVGLVATSDMDAIYVQKYDNLHQDLKHCSGDASSIFLSLSLILFYLFIFLL